MVEPEDLDPRPEGCTPTGQPPKPPLPEDLEPGLDYPFVWHGYSWFKGPFKILAGDRWVRRKLSGKQNARGRCPRLDEHAWRDMPESEKDREWSEYLERFGPPPKIPTPEEMKER